MEFESKILSRQIGDLIYASGYSLGTAESCTGGRISETIIAIPGASNYFKGGIVSYTDEVKIRLLGVSADTLQEHTAVSEEVAKQMARGAIEALQVDFAISVTGIAGPGGGTTDIPVGTIWIGYGTCRTRQESLRRHSFYNLCPSTLSRTKRLHVFQTITDCTAVHTVSAICCFVFTPRPPIPCTKDNIC